MFELGFFNNCDELIKFLIDNHDNPICGNASFQGDSIDINGYAHPREISECVPLSENSMEFFIIGEVNEVTNTFVLVITDNATDYPDEDYGVELPAYVRDELIATLKGEW